MTNPIYYLKDGSTIYRRFDGDPTMLPTMVFHPSGWMPVAGQLKVSWNSYPAPSSRGTAEGGPDPSMWHSLERISEEEAQEIAARKGLPTEGW